MTGNPEVISSPVGLVPTNALLGGTEGVVGNPEAIAAPITWLASSSETGRVARTWFRKVSLPEGCAGLPFANLLIPNNLQKFLDS
jgi:hypothetical protein